MGSKQPKKVEIIARGVALRGGRVLLCRDIESGYRFLPGGHVEPGESSEEALAREFEEESGLKVRVGAFLMANENRFVQKGKPRHEVNLVFHVEHGSGPWPDTCPSLEDHIAFDWVDLAAVQEARILPTAMAAWLAAGGPGEPLERHDGAWISHRDG